MEFKLKISKPICLIGMTYAGKTTIGKRIAKKFKFDFVDLDLFISQNLNTNINEIFLLEGEEQFRNYEHNALNTIVNNSNGNLIISSGGGVIMRQSNRKILSQKTINIFLSINLKLLFERLKNSKSRPIFKGSTIDNKKKLENLLMQRKIWYEDLSNLKIYINKNTSQNDIDKQISKFLQNYNEVC